MEQRAIFEPSRPFTREAKQLTCWLGSNNGQPRKQNERHCATERNRNKDSKTEASKDLLWPNDQRLSADSEITSSEIHCKD